MNYMFTITAPDGSQVESEDTRTLRAFIRNSLAPEARTFAENMIVGDLADKTWHSLSAAALARHGFTIARSLMLDAITPSIA